MHGKEYLAFTKKERSGILVLLVLLVVVVVAPKLFQGQNSYQSNIYTDVDLDSIKSVLTERQNQYSNKLDSSNRKVPRDVKYSREWKSTDYKRSSKNMVKKRALPQIEINTADTSAFVALPFIGSRLAARIVLFRQKLGGFTHTQQLREVYGLSDTAFIAIEKYLTCDASKIMRIKVNDADIELLKNHPYVRWQLAKQLVNYRTQHGHYRKIDDLFGIDGVDSSTITRISPYLEFN